MHPGSAILLFDLVHCVAKETLSQLSISHTHTHTPLLTFTTMQPLPPFPCCILPYHFLHPYKHVHRYVHNWIRIGDIDADLLVQGTQRQT